MSGTPKAASHGCDELWEDCVAELARCGYGDFSRLRSMVAQSIAEMDALDGTGAQVGVRAGSRTHVHRQPRSVDFGRGA